MSTKYRKIKNNPRLKNKIRIRKRIATGAGRPRVSVFRSSKHTYAQVISDETAATIASASTLEAEVKEEIAKVEKEGLFNDSRSTKSVAAAVAVGLVLARRVREKNITSVVFDRNGFIYAGRIKAVADGARKGGLEF